MTIYQLPTMTEQAALPCGSVIALGFFDGVHLGHRSIIDTARRTAEETGGEVAVWMISPGDKSFKRGTKGLTDVREKFTLLHSAGARYAAVCDFSEIRELDGATFVNEILKRRLDASAVVCGFNFRFGKGASCTTFDLEKLCAPCGIRTIALPAVTDEAGDVISSTRIRALISEGEVTRAALMLGRPYSFTADVIRGKRLGRTLGFPTANQLIPEDRLTPGRGVYAVAVEFDDGGRMISLPGGANVGFCPTLTDDVLREAGVQRYRSNSVGCASEGHAVCETFIIGYSGNLYGKSLTVRFLRRLRGELKFDSVDELKAQIGIDAAHAVEVYNEIYGS